jgi:hypothetical protein
MTESLQQESSEFYDFFFLKRNMEVKSGCNSDYRCSLRETGGKNQKRLKRRR